MARKKKRDFWDDIDEDVVPQEEPVQRSVSAGNQDEYTDYDGDEGFKLTKCMPAKIIARILLCIAAVVVGLSAYICFKYVDDRYTDGVYSTSYFDSNGFSREYNESINKLIKLLQAIEAEGEVTPERVAEMSASVLGANTNFSFFIVNENQERVAVSSDDARERIESSNHFLQIETVNNEFKVTSGVPTIGLNKTAWKTALDECNNAYTIYTAVDNNLTQQDSFYESYLDYQKMTDYFGKAKIFGIAALVVFIILLVYCVMATGTRKGYYGVHLTWFDKIFTEVAAILIFAIVGGLIYGLYYLMGHDMKFGTYLKAADAFLIYVFLIRGYFSLVRRIKAGTFITNAVIYKACHGINVQLSKLPKAVKVIIILLFLIALNGALVYALLYMRDITITSKSIPVIFIVAPIVFIIELIGFISCIFGVGDDEDYYEDEDELPQEPVQAIEKEDEPESWEDVDFSKDIKIPESGGYEDHSSDAQGATQQNIHTKVTDKTVVLSNEERQKVLDSLGFGEPEPLRPAQKPAARKAARVETNTENVKIVEPSKVTTDTVTLPGLDMNAKKDAVTDSTVVMEPVRLPSDEDVLKKPVSAASGSKKAGANATVTPGAAGGAAGKTGDAANAAVKTGTASSAVDKSAATAGSAKAPVVGSTASADSAAKAAATAGSVKAPVAGTTASASKAAAGLAGAASADKPSAAGAAVRTSGFDGAGTDQTPKTPEQIYDELGLVDFIQLNKDVRKLFRLKLKARSIGVTLRAPEKPIYLDIDKANAIKVLSILFDNIEKYAEEGTRVYIEMYAQNGKIIYLMKNTIRENLLDQTTNAMGRGLMEAKRIVQSERGKFINSVEGEIYKVGILLDVADPENF